MLTVIDNNDNIIFVHIHWTAFILYTLDISILGVFSENIILTVKDKEIMIALKWNKHVET